ncbi:Alkaline-phosphatase-like family protein [Forsythia ovata]|uniref:Alkaline-phosphatase-like family protein n=1 Tax=Forsythia ovata TaxID=205694 RepID=A0ABD1U9W8_9LAMI
MNTKTISNSSSLTCTKLTLLTVLAVLIQITGLSIFIMGFFPVKPTLSGISGLESFYPPGSDPTDLSQNVSTLPPDKLKSFYQELSGVPPVFDRLVLMVIDGLPAEFVLGRDGMHPRKEFVEAMPYTQSLLAKGLAIGYHAKAAPPTVTMPRLKAMVSGAIGGFLDVAFNFNTQAFLDDNLIVQFFRFGWKMVMLGDETWLKLFPTMFTRCDGVSSFFVKDTIQVDYNVSRHLADELKSTDWDLLILHYLGLDHVGHNGGRNSNLMTPKLMEMDEVIKMIHSSTIQTQEVKQRGTLLLVVSDHGMTESGNHGGSSYEETDSLALFISPGTFNYTSETNNKAFQVDIAVTLALLFGVPIPKNNVGTLMAEVFTSLTDEQQLRILELNSWQLLRLLQAQFPELECGRFSCEPGSVGHDDAEMFCCLYLDAAALFESWKSKSSSRSVGGDDYRSIVLAYQNFLRSASKWLSGRATDKPTGLLACGIAAMLLSCSILVGLIFVYGRDSPLGGIQHLSHKENMKKGHLDEIFILAVIFILILSMGSSSMVEEEQYIWHFMTASLYLILLRKTLQSSTPGRLLHAQNVNSKQKRSCSRIYSIVAVLTSGRILRGWHQGGVNWAHLPDISKFLEQAGSAPIKSLQLISILLVISISLTAILWPFWKSRFVMLFTVIFLFPGWLVLQDILNYQDSIFASASSDAIATTMAQNIYALLSIFTVGTLFAIPWFMPLKNSKTSRLCCFSIDISPQIQSEPLLWGFRDSIYVIGWCCVFSWCLLQLLLQQPINSMPVLLLLVQILASIWYFSDGDPHTRQWVEVAALYYVGMAGHFGLGNTNTLATIDVAGAFIGVSSHSTFISGILMFIITYASPMLALLSMLIYVSAKDMSAFVDTQNEMNFGHLLKMCVGYPCLVPLGLNSIFLVAYTIVLLLMRNHLFVWSVFSPKYLYVCATTACIYIGTLFVALATTYTCMAFATRRMWKGFCWKG